MARKSREAARRRRHFRVRKKVRGTAERPRIAVYRSNRHIQAQIIDDDASRTLVAASTLESDLRDGSGGIGGAKKVGQLLAERAKGQGVTRVVFDRGGYLYHGRVAALAEAAREAGLEF